MSLRSLLICLCLLCAASAVRAQSPIVQEQFYSFDTPGSANLSFNKFDPSLGTLLSVEYYFESTLIVFFELSGTADVTASANLSASLPSGLNPSLNPTSTDTFFNTGGGQVFVVDAVSTSGTDSNTLTYVGAGSFIIAVTGTGNTTADPMSVLSLENQEVAGMIRITFNFAPASAVPEPSDSVYAGILLIGGAGLLLRKRRAQV